MKISVIKRIIQENVSDILETSLSSIESQGYPYLAGTNKKYKQRKFPVMRRSLSETNDYLDFEIHDTLTDKIWDGDSIKPDVREKLIKIAIAFYKFIKIEAKLTDVIIIGSAVNYNYSEKYSDIDLHLVYDFDKILNESDDVIRSDVDLLEQYLLAKKSQWNDEFDITINGFGVEVYAQDSDDEITSGGIFSVAKNEWIKKPEKVDVEMDIESAEKKAKQFMKVIDSAISRKVGIDDIEKIMDAIWEVRGQGLEDEAGEFSVGNIMFKILRRSGYLDKLIDYETEIQSDSFSL